MIINFLKKSEQKKIQILFFLVQQNNYTATLDNISITLALDMRILKRLINDLKRDFSKIKSTKFKIHMDKKKCELHTPIEKQTNIIINKIFSIYLDKSLEFNLFKSIVYSKKNTIISLSIENSISESHCYLIIRKLNTYLKKYKISILNYSGNLELSGSEMNILFFISEVTKYITIFNEYPMLKNTRHFDFLEKANIPSRVRDTYLLRINKKQAIIIENNEIRELLEVYKSIHDAHPCLAINTKKKERKDSNFFYNLFVRISISDFDTKENRIKIGGKLVELTHNSIINFSMEFANQIMDTYINKYFSSMKKKDIFHELIYLLCLHYSYIDSIKVDINLQMKNSLYQDYHNSQDENYSSLKENITNLTKNMLYFQLPNNPNLIDIYSNQIIDIISPIIFSIQNPKINIFVNTSDFFTSGKSLQRQITNFFSSEMINFVHSYNEADIVISDSPINNYKSLPSIVLYDKFSNSLWKDMLILIATESHNILLNKINQKY